MTKVTINPSPEPESAAPAPITINATIKDKRGRSITIGEPDFLAQFRVTEAAGKSAESEPYMNMVRPLLYIRKIDGDDISTPTNKLLLEALISRVGEDGYSAVCDHLMKVGKQRVEADLKKS